MKSGKSLDERPGTRNGKKGILVLKGQVQRVTFASQETGFAVLRVKPSKGAGFTATGHVPELATRAGLVGTEFEFHGNWTRTKYGRQFSFTSCKLLGSELLFFLSKVVKGLGAKMAKRLIEIYGEDKLVSILDSEPEVLLEVKGIKEKRLNLIIKSWKKHKNLKALSDYLASCSARVTPNLLIKIYNYFGDEALSIIKRNPYQLTEIRGIGFKTADKIAMGLGLQYNSPARIRAAIIHVLTNAAEEEGHSYLEECDLIDELMVLLPVGEEKSVSQGDIGSVIDQMSMDGALVRGSSGEIGLSSLKYMEDWLADFFKDKVSCSRSRVIPLEKVDEFIDIFENQRQIELSPEQKEIIRQVGNADRTIFALAGYAGTGKTTVCRGILELLLAHYAPEEDIVCCAFTGMASARLRKATGYPAYTIHSLLGYKGDNSFEYGPDRPLPYKVVILDEASMVNLTLFYRLARALDPSTLFILVGDPAQLPPIGAGNVFSDALKSQLVPSVHLTRIYRQSEDSVLALFANEVRQGFIPDGIYKDCWSDFSFRDVERHRIFAMKKGRTERELKQLREENNQAILDHILKLASGLRDKLDHPVWDFQVLTPMRVGQLGTEVLNHSLQKILNVNNGTAISRSGIRLCEGDKVVHLQNKDMGIMSWSDFVRSGKEFHTEESRRIFNGYVGLVAKIDTDAEQFYVVYPDRSVVSYDFDHLGDIIELAYALTVHKAQGSQYKIVAIPLSNSHYIMLNNKWFYTAITRAENKVFLVGQKYALKRACTNVDGVKRLTWLGRELVS